MSGATAEASANGAIETKPSSLYSKLIAAAASVSGVEKNGKNTQQNYDYAKAEDVIAAASKALVGAGLALLPTMGEVETLREYETRSGSYGVTVRVEMLYMVVDPETGESIERRYLGTGSDSPGDKAIYKAVTGAAKYFYAGLLGIGFGADPENDTGGEGAEPVSPTVAQNVVRLNPERTERIIAGFGALRLPYSEINLMLGACGVDALATNTPEAIRATVAGLGEVQADALEVEMRKAEQDADATAPDAAGLPDEIVEGIMQGIEITGLTSKEVVAETGLDTLNIELGSLGIDAFGPDAPVVDQIRKLTEDQAAALSARLQVLADDAGTSEEADDGK